MCYSERLSLLSFTIGILFSGLLLTFRDTPFTILGLFLGYVSLMQFIEYLLWSHQVCDDYNKFVSVIGMILNHSQPIVLGILLLIFSKLSNMNVKIIKLLVIIYTIGTILYSHQYLLPKNNKCTLKNDNPYLLWNWNSMKHGVEFGILYIVVLTLLLYFGIEDKKLAYTSIIIGDGLLLSNYLIYPRPFVGAIWCYYVAFIPMILYFIKKWNIV
jgi:hypothetical protein